MAIDMNDSDDIPPAFITRWSSKWQMERYNFNIEEKHTGIIILMALITKAEKNKQ